jgi:hypothetical protein
MHRSPADSVARADGMNFIQLILSIHDQQVLALHAVLFDFVQNNVTG